MPFARRGWLLVGSLLVVAGACSSGTKAEDRSGYSTTLVNMINPKLPEAAIYPDGAWDYHSDKQLIQNDTMGREKLLRIFINVNENDIGSTRADSTKLNWVTANRRTAAALKVKGYHYKFVYGLGQSHCSTSVRNATLADALMWVWRGYQSE